MSLPNQCQRTSTEDYLNTTNPYSNFATPKGALAEVDDQEGNKPLYVLVFGDEEVRAIVWWDEWTEMQLERGDESLVANFGIDIRILDFLEWDSNDSIQRMDDPEGFDLCDELLADNGHYLRTWYNGPWWSSYVDAIIGITKQSTPNDPEPLAGVAPSLSELDQGIIFVLLKWQCYWMDDNLVQHEVSHLYYAPDHPEPQPPAPCCAMAYHTHYQTFIWEDGLWWVFDNVACAMTTYSWCTSCYQTIQQNCGIYPLDIRTLVISASSGGTTDPPPGNHTYRYGKAAIVTAIPDPLYLFYSWNLDGAIVFSNPINVTMDSNHTLKAYFGTPAMKTKTDGYFYVPSVATDLLEIEMLFDNQNITGDQTGGTSPYATITDYPDGKVNILDVFFISKKFGLCEGDTGWDYMADVVPSRKIDILDTFVTSKNFGYTGTYITDLAGVEVFFNTGEVRTPDSYGFVEIPQGAASFTVKRNGNPTGAMIIFW